MKLSNCYKVPFRDVYCETLRDCIAQTIYCHVVLRIASPWIPPENGPK